MREYCSYNDIRLAMGEKKSVCFWAPALEGLRKELEDRRISFTPTWNDPPTTLRVITIFLPGKISIRIRQVPPIAPMFRRPASYILQRRARSWNTKAKVLVHSWFEV